MTTEVACLSTVWITDRSVKQWFSVHGRSQDYCELRHDKGASYDGRIEIDLGEIESMIALSFHPSNVFTIHSLCENESFLEDVLESVEKDAAVRSGGLTLTLRDKIQIHRFIVQQAVVGGCASESLYGKSGRTLRSRKTVRSGGVDSHRNNHPLLYLWSLLWQYEYNI